MGAVQTARSRARTELIAAIKTAARRQLGARGPAGLSLREVARELEMAPSALYRYFRGKDELLTALIIDAYAAMGDWAETALADVAVADFLTRWRVTCHSLRGWATAHPHEYALIYGSPVPGYQAPTDTIDPASRVPTLLLGLVRDAWDAGQLSPPGQVPPLPANLAEDARRLGLVLDLPRLPADVLTLTITAWTQLIGAISLELFGHLKGSFADNEPFFYQTIEVMANLIGLRPTGTAEDDLADPTAWT